MAWSNVFVWLLIPLAVSAKIVVRIEEGLIEGSSLVTRNGKEIQAFRGIPYAEAPVGDLRFQVSDSSTLYGPKLIYLKFSRIPFQSEHGVTM